MTADDSDTAAATPTADQPETQVDSAPPITEVTPSAEPAGPADFPVGERVSRPFVYETPGPAGQSPSSRRREPGQVRLRRYLVTEVVTETGTGQRHEVRVEAEPFDQEGVDSAAATSNPEDEPARREPPEPDPTTGSVQKATTGGKTCNARVGCADHRSAVSSSLAFAGAAGGGLDG